MLRSAPRQLAQENGVSMYEIISHADSYPELSRPALKMRAFAQMIEELRAFAKDNTPDVLLDELIEKTGYIRALEEKNTIEDRTRIENVQELKSSIIGYMKEAEDDTLEGYLANVALYTDLDNYDTETDAVVMMTMHAAKGLEFPSVYIVGMEEGIFPGMRAIGEHEEMEEERRLCYVAITRAERHLEMTCARQRMLFGRTTANRVSRFVDEIPDEHIEKNIPKGYAHRDKSREESYQHRRTSYGHLRGGVTAPAAAASGAGAGTAASFAVGDSIEHKAFGEGVIMKMTPMGGDFLVEINFKQGVKRLMLRAAAPHMTKI